MLKNAIFVSAFLILLVACQQQNNDKSNKTSLYKYGIPVYIEAPEDVRFHKSASNQIEGLSVVNDAGYQLQVFQYTAAYNDVQSAKNHHREQVVTNPFFSKIVEDYDHGFLFELVNDDKRYYDFRIIKVVGAKEIVFQTTPTVNCTEEDARMMLLSVQ